MILFTLQKIVQPNNTTIYRIRPESIKELHLGFEGAKKKKA